MANDINSVVLCGRLTRDLGADPNGKDFVYTQNSMCIARISIAVNKSKKQADGSYANEADFYDVTLFGKLAENLKPYLTKGKQIVVQGHLNQDKWVDQQTGQNRSKIGIIADNIQLVGGQSQNGNGQGYQQQGQNYQQAPQQSYQQQPNSNSMPQSPQQPPAQYQNQGYQPQQFNQQEQNGMNQAFGGNQQFKEDLPWENTDIPF